MKLNSDYVILQKATPLAKSKLWDIQRTFFENQGINAWDHKVPFYITNNLYIANAYANICVRFMQDCIKKGKYNCNEPFYILELGAGCGRFSFYTLKRLLELQQILALDTVKFVYVMSDFAQKNVHSWSQHPLFQTYLQRGVLDFAIYNAEQNQQLQLLRAGKALETSFIRAENNNPLIAIANYFFDTISHDVFQIVRGKLQAGLIKLLIKRDNLKDSLPIKLETIQTEFSYRNIPSNYYTDAEFNALLAYYHKHYTSLRFLLPTGSLWCIKQLQKIARGQLLLITTDKGYTDNYAQHSQLEPNIALHASFSMMVNFHAISQYFKQGNGDYYYPLVEQGIVSAAFVSGDKFNTLPETRHALSANFENLGPGNLFSLTNYVMNTQATCDLETILTNLYISHWDPELFNACGKAILEKLSNCDSGLRHRLLEALPKIAANYYPLSGNEDTLFNIGYLLQVLGNHAEALIYYLQSYNYSKKNADLCHNIGICYFNLHHYEQAKNYFQKALVINPDNVLAHGWLVHVSDKVSRS